jgi:hypothetical protein
MMSTPKYIIGAVRQLVENAEPKYLIEMFLNGLPLHQYPETSSLIAQLMRGERIRPKGRPPKTEDERVKDKAIIALVAQMVAVGYPLITKGERTVANLSVCDVIGKQFGVSREQVYKIYKRDIESDFVEQNKAFATKRLTKNDFHYLFI